MGLPLQSSAARNDGSVELIQKKIAELQLAYMQKLQAAQASGDVAGIQRLAAEFQSEMARLLQSFQPGRAASGAPVGSGVGENREAPIQLPNEERLPADVIPIVSLARPPALKQRIYDNAKCSMDLDLAVYDGDRNSIIGLLTDPVFVQVAEHVLDEKAVFNSRRQLLKRCLHLTPKMAPQLHQIGQRCRQTLGLKAALDFYVYQDLFFNAACYPPSEDRLFILLTSSLLEKFTEDELTFVIGHEIGHALFDHHRFPINTLLEKGGDDLSPIHAMRIYAWKRNAEISADRIGLVCSQSFEAAARAFFKLSSGITAQDSLSFQMREYLDQFKDLKQEMMTNTDMDPEDWYSTHPFSPIRLKALELFHQSVTFNSLIGGAGGEISSDAMESEIKSFMSMMEPSYLNDATELSQVMRDYVFLGGFLIAAAHGVVDDSEIKALCSILDPATVQVKLAKIGAYTDGEQIWAELKGLAEKLNVHLPIVTKLNLIKDLSVISYADGSIEQSEVETLYKLCRTLQIRPEFADHVLESVLKPMD